MNTNQKKILQKILRDTDELVNRPFKKKTWLSNSFSKNDSKYCDISIESGEAGYILFLIEAYYHSNFDKYLETAVFTIDKLYEHSLNTRTKDFSLFRGLGGVIYCLIEIFDATGDSSFLLKAQNLAKSVTKEFVQSKYTSNYLYNGRSGFLLVLLKLLSREFDKSLQEIGNRLLTQVIGEGELKPEGLSWRESEELVFNNSCSYAFGSEGIKYVLKQLDFGDDSGFFGKILLEIERYQDNCWVDKEKNWSQFRIKIENGETLNRLIDQFPKIQNQTSYSWANGYFGIAKSQLSYDEDYLFENDVLENKKCTESNLHDGIYGILLCLPDKEHSELFENCLEDFKISAKRDNVLTGGLMFGDLGKAYSILNYIRHNNSGGFDNILFPKVDRKKSKNKVFLQINKEAVQIAIHRKNYPKTTELLMKLESEKLASYFTRNHASFVSEFKSFTAFLNKTLKDAKDTPIYMVLKDVIHYENQRLAHVNKLENSPLEKHLTNFSYRKCMFQLPLNDTIWLKNQTLKLSKKTVVIDSGWIWSDKNLSPLNNFFSSPDYIQTVIYQNYDGKFDEISLIKEGAILEFFIKENKVEHALQSIISKWISEKKSYLSIKIPLEDFFLLQIRELIYVDVLNFSYI